MLRSGAASPTRRAAGYIIAGGCVAFYVYALVLLAILAASSDSVEVVAWVSVWALVTLVATVCLAVVVSRQPHAGGYVLVAGASLVGAALCLIGLIPFVAF